MIFNPPFRRWASSSSSSPYLRRRGRRRRITFSPAFSSITPPGKIRHTSVGILRPGRGLFGDDEHVGHVFHARKATEHALLISDPRPLSQAVKPLSHCCLSKQRCDISLGLCSSSFSLFYWQHFASQRLGRPIALAIHRGIWWITGGTLARTPSLRVTRWISP